MLRDERDMTAVREGRRRYFFVCRNEISGDCFRQAVGDRCLHTLYPTDPLTSWMGRDLDEPVTYPIKPNRRGWDSLLGEARA